MRRNDPPVKKRVKVLAEHKPNDQGVRDESFISEGKKLQEFYKRNFPDTEVDILPFYGREEFDNHINDIDGNDVFLFGHRGHMLGGVEHEEIAKVLKDKNVDNCYMGSCSMKGYAKPYQDSLSKFHHRDEGSWYGVNPKAKDVVSAMYSKTYTGNPNDYYGAGIVEPTEGKEYTKTINRQTENPVMYKTKPKVFKSGGQMLQHLFADGSSPGAMGAGILGSLIPTDTVGGKTASTALTGAMTGAQFGPKGAAVGALAGGALGLVSSLANKKREEEGESRRHELEKRMFRNHSRSVLSNYPTEGVDSSGFYRSGGKMKSHDFMTTGGYLSPVASDVSLANGKTHNEGGIDLYDNNMDNFAEIEDQEIIKQDKVYSNRLKVPVYLQQALKLKRK